MKLIDALSRISTIHQQHSIKCFHAINYLKNQFNWPKQDWVKIDELVELEEPLHDVHILSEQSSVESVVRRRRHWVLAHALYPHSYYVMLDWFNEAPFNEIFEYYLSQAVAQKEYLNHHISILLAFKNTHPLLENSEQTYLFIERFCEFVTATFYGNNHLSFPVGSAIKQPVFEINTVFEACLNKPGFWGHNIITFACLIQSKDDIGDSNLKQLLANLYEQCFWKFEDESDTPLIQKTNHPIAEQNVLERVCHRLLFSNSSNLHQITLASSLVYLFEHSESQQHRSRLLDIALHFSEQ